MNQTCPAESRTVNPGITPSFLAEITVQPPGAGLVPDPGPLTSSATVGLKPHPELWRRLQESLQLSRQSDELPA